MDSLTSIVDRRLLRQVVAISPVLIYAISQTMLFFMPELALNDLWKREPKLYVYDRNEMVNLYRIFSVTDIVGSVASAALMKYIGRRTTHRIFTAAGVIAFLTNWFATDPRAIKSGSAFVGLSIGGSNSLGCIMIGEYANPKYRGVFLYLKNLMLAISGMITMLIIPHVSYTTVAIIGLVPLIISFAIIQMTPETPIWLASRNKYNESETVFYELRGEDPESTKEIKEVIETQETLHAAEATKKLGENIVASLSKFTSLEFLKPFGIIVIAVIFLEFCGRNYLGLYSVAIAHRFIHDDAMAFNNKLVYILTSVSALISVILIKNCRQRVLLLSTGSLACFILMLVLFFSAIIPVARPAIIVTMLSIYCLLINLCCSPLPLVLVGELFSWKHKGVGVVATEAVSQILKYAVGKLTVYILMQDFNIRWMLLIYSAVTSVGLIILYYVLPETKDLSLQDIERIFEKKNKTERAQLQGVELGRVDQNI